MNGVFEMIDYKQIIKNRELRLQLIKLLSFIPDKPYLKLVYWIKTGKKLNLKNPEGFNEKLNWLKLNKIHPEYTELVDKLSVRKYISETIGEDALFPLLGSWDRFEDIDFDSLPDKFVLKCNHDSGSVKIINDKKSIDKKELSAFFDRRLKLNAFCLGREYPYKDVKPKIMAEAFMETPDGQGLNDYKFFCFNGKPEILFVATDRSTDVKFDFFDMDFNHLDIYNIHEQSGKEIPKPACFEQMKEIAAKLTKGMEFVRLDLYEIDGHIYFGEFTFFHGGGYYLFHPEHWEKDLGDLIET